MTNKLWAELTQARFNLEFCALYSERQRLLLKWFNILVLAFSTSGVMGWKVWDNVPLIACLVVSGLSLLRLVQPHLIMTERQIAGIDSLHMFYIEYYNKLEEFWFDVELSSLSEKQIIDRLYQLKTTETPILQKVNDLDLRKPIGLTKKAEREANIYLCSHFNISNEQKEPT